MKTYLVTLSLIFLMAGCEKGNKDECIFVPDPFNFKIIDRYSRKDLVFSMTPVYYADSMRFFYIRDGEPAELSIQAAKSSHQYDIFRVEIVPYLSALQGIKDYYLQLNYQDMDTLLIDVREIDLGDCTVYEYKDCYFNGGIMNTNTDDRTVFLIEK